MGGVARRNWARNDNAIKTAEQWNFKHHGEGHITIPFVAEENFIKEQVDKLFGA
jgi:urocanate hydratase